MYNIIMTPEIRTFKKRKFLSIILNIDLYILAYIQTTCPVPFLNVRILKMKTQTLIHFIFQPFNGKQDETSPSDIQRL